MGARGTKVLPRPSFFRTGDNTMSKLKRLVVAAQKEEIGATAIEYGLIASTIALAIIVTMGTLGQHLSATFGRLANAI
jgi:pilus assembly protein Flp/PilA